MASYSREWAARIGIEAARFRRRYQIAAWVVFAWFVALMFWVALTRSSFSGEQRNYVALATLVISLLAFVPLILVFLHLKKRMLRAAADEVAAGSGGKVFAVPERVLRAIPWFDKWALDNGITPPNEQRD